MRTFLLQLSLLPLSARLALANEVSTNKDYLVVASLLIESQCTVMLMGLHNMATQVRCKGVPIITGVWYVKWTMNAHLLTFAHIEVKLALLILLYVRVIKHYFFSGHCRKFGQQS